MRDKTIDIAKGIGIILMIIGHSRFCFIDHQWVVRFIYSFHMPLFFIITGYFIKDTSVFQLKKEFHRLLLPYILVSVCLIIIRNVRVLWFEGTWDWKVALGALYGSGGTVLGYQIPSNIPIYLWFLLCMFFSKLLFQTVVLPHKKHRLWIVALLSIAGYVCGKFIWLPFCLCQALVAVSFIYAGYITKERKYTENELSMLLLAWFSGAYLSSFDLATNHYPLLFLSLFVAFAGTVLTIAFSKQVSKFPCLSNVLNFYGRYSLAVLCLNCVEILIVPWYRLYDWVHVHFLLGVLVVMLHVAFIGILVYGLKRFFWFRSIFMP